MALLLGCKDITTIGWDLTTGVHSYKDDEVEFKPNKDNVDIERTDDSIKTTKELSEWFEKENINFRIISDVNSASDKIKRVKSINEISATNALTKGSYELLGYLERIWEIIFISYI